MKRETFTTETGLIWQAHIDKQGFTTKIKLVTKVPRGYYYSCLNDIGFHYEELLREGKLKEYEA